MIIYGDAGLKKDHPVVSFLAKDGHAQSLCIYKDGFDAFQRVYPFCCTASLKSGSVKRFPSQLDSHLYLGDWEQAAAAERLQELNIKRSVSGRTSACAYVCMH